MAQVACERGDGNNAVFVGTFLETGTSVALCNDDLINFCVSMSEQLTGAPVIQFLEDWIPPKPEEVAVPSDEAIAEALDTLLTANAEEVASRIEAGEEMQTIIEDLMTRPLDEIDPAELDSTVTN
jgi:hypothetical protein